MSVGIATMGMFNTCCGGGINAGGGAPPVHQYEARGEEPSIHIDIIKVSFKKPKSIPTISINVGDVRSERKI